MYLCAVTVCRLQECWIMVVPRNCQSLLAVTLITAVPVSTTRFCFLVPRQNFETMWTSRLKLKNINGIAFFLSQIRHGTVQPIRDEIISYWWKQFNSNERAFVRISQMHLIRDWVYSQQLHWPHVEFCVAWTSAASASYDCAILVNDIQVLSSISQRNLLRNSIINSKYEFTMRINIELEDVKRCNRVIWSTTFEDYLLLLMFPGLCASL